MDTFLCSTLFLLSFWDSDGTNVTVLDRPLLSSGGKGEPGGKGFCFRRVGATFTYLDIITNAQELPEEAFYIQYWCPRPTVTKYNKLSGLKKWMYSLTVAGPISSKSRYPQDHVFSESYSEILPVSSPLLMVYWKFYYCVIGPWVSGPWLAAHNSISAFAVTWSSHCVPLPSNGQVFIFYIRTRHIALGSQPILSWPHFS